MFVGPYAMRCCVCFRGHSDKFDPLIFLLQEMARAHYAKMGPKMQSIKSEPGESHVAQPRLLQVLHGLKKTSTSPPGRRTQAMRDGALNTLLTLESALVLGLDS